MRSPSWLDWKNSASMPIWVQHNSSNPTRPLPSQLTGPRLGRVHHVEVGAVNDKFHRGVACSIAAVTASPPCRCFGITASAAARYRGGAPPPHLFQRLGADEETDVRRPPSAHPRAGRGRARRRSDAAPRSPADAPQENSCRPSLAKRAVWAGDSFPLAILALGGEDVGDAAAIGGDLSIGR